MKPTTRLILYVSIAALTVLISDFGKLDPEVAKEMYWTQWVVMIGSPVIAGLIAWRAFLDQSITRTKENPLPK